MTLGRAPSIPATATTTDASSNRSRWARRRWIPATPTSHRRSTGLPVSSAVRAASSATGMSVVPPVATTTVPRARGGRDRTATTQRAASWYTASGRTSRTAS